MGAMLVWRLRVAVDKPLSGCWWELATPLVIGAVTTKGLEGSKPTALCRHRARAEGLRV